MEESQHKNLIGWKPEGLTILFPRLISWRTVLMSKSPNSALDVVVSCTVPEENSYEREETRSVRSMGRGVLWRRIRDKSRRPEMGRSRAEKPAPVVASSGGFKRKGRAVEVCQRRPRMRAERRLFMLQTSVPVEQAWETVLALVACFSHPCSHHEKTYTGPGLA